MSDDIRFESLVLAPAPVGLVPLVTCALIVAGIFRARQGLTVRDLIWCIPQPLLLLAVAVFYLLGLGPLSPVSLVLCCGAAYGAHRLVLVRHTPPLRLPATLALYVLLATLTLELTWNERFYTIGPQFWLVELALIGGVSVSLWLVGRRSAVLLVPLLVALFVVGIVQHYVVQFRGTAILPSDILAFHTALSVSAGYTYALSHTMLLGVGALSLGLAVSSWLVPLRDAGERPYAAELGIAVACLAAVAALAYVPSYADVFGADIDYWWSKDWYERQGFIPSFIYAWQDLDIDVPSGYSDDAARKAASELTALAHATEPSRKRREDACDKFQKTPPNIVVIQNETFCDLSVFGDLGDGYRGPVFFKEGLTDALARGDLAVSVFGGGTCNTEFEFLCGISLAFVGSAKYPFTMYDLTHADSLPKQLRTLGYAAIGMHPNIASNWNRDRAYEELGFDEFLSIDSFADAETFHTHVSDQATYDRTLELIEEHTEPVFVFDVTMQNHSGYDTGSIPKDLLPSLAPAGLGDSDTAELREFVACITESDRAFERLVERLRASDEPTIVCMYGDHHPWFSETLNDLVFPDEDALAHGERIHNTSYVIWANYDLEPFCESEATSGSSADLLASELLDLAGAPLTDLQTAQVGLRQEISALNAYGYRDADGTWHTLDAYPALLHDLALIEYRDFGSKV